MIVKRQCLHIISMYLSKLSPAEFQVPLALQSDLQMDYYSVPHHFKVYEDDNLVAWTYLIMTQHNNIPCRCCTQSTLSHTVHKTK